MTSKNRENRENGENPKSSKIANTVVLMMLITLVGKIMGILRDRMQGVYFGTDTIESIAFTQASLLPRVFLDIMFASVLSASFIPIFNRYLEKQDKEAALNLAASFVRIVFLVTAAVSLLAVLFAEPIYMLFWFDATTANPQTVSLGIMLLQIMFPIMLISGLAFSFTGILQSMGQFNIPAAMSIASNGVILLYYWLFIDYFGVVGLAVAFLLGWSMQVIIQIPFLLKHGFFGVLVRNPLTSKKTQNPQKSALKEIGKLTLPVMVASWLAPVNFLVNNRAAINLYGGGPGVVALNYANNLYAVITGLFVLSLANVLFPALSKLAAHDDWQQYTDFLRSSLRWLLFFLVPMSFGLMAVAWPLVVLVYQDGLFQEESVRITATALFFFSMGILGFGLQAILSRACFALKDGKSPLITALIAIVINAVLSFALVPALEIGGPALASAAAVTVAAAGLLFRLQRRLPAPLWDKQTTWNMAKILALSTLMYAAVSFSVEIFSNIFSSATLLNRVIILVVPASVGLMIYIAGALIIKVPESRLAMRWLLDKFTT
ncbi:MAG: murein biosynthesis integral membrane protein MurJ [Defluviitaleaceae bacterium]|nr:murein biosynthesis integral membrane protein MurJ [Defluviitaleaceae bacterium]